MSRYYLTSLPAIYIFHIQSNLPNKGHIYITNHCPERVVSFLPLMNIDHTILTICKALLPIKATFSDSFEWSLYTGLTELYKETNIE